MANDTRDLLTVLRAELSFLDAGKYETSVPSWRPAFLFEDSPTCLNYGDPERRRPCGDCVLARLARRDAQFAKLPCRSISLNARGETLNDLYRYATEREIHETVRAWLVENIERLERLKKTNHAAAVGRV